MKYPLHKYLLVTICLLSFPMRSFPQNIEKEDEPRCCYPIISEVNSKVGFIDETGRVVVPPIFLANEPSVEFLKLADYTFSEGLAAVEVSGKDVLTPVWSIRSERSDDRESSQESKWGFIDQRGEMIIAPTYAAAFNFSEGLAAVESEGKWGFIDRKGEMVIALKYAEVRSFSDGLAAVRVAGSPGNTVDSKWGFVDRKGQIVIAAAYEAVSDFSEGLAAVKVLGTTGNEADSKWGFIDQRGRMVIAPAYDMALPFSDGLAAVRAFSANGKEGQSRWGVINQKGEIVIAPTYQEALSFSDGVAAIELPGGKLGIVDRQGALLSTAFRFGEDIASSIDSPYRNSGYDDLLTPYDDLDVRDEPIFSEGLYPVKIGRKWGYINRLGKIVIGPRFDFAGNFQEGLARVGVGRAFGFIDKHGKYLIPPRLRYASDFSDGLALVFFQRSFRRLPTNADERRQQTIIYGYINHKGQTVFKGRNVFTDELQGGDGNEILEFPPQVTVTIKSSPNKANIYLVPFKVWDLDESIFNDDKRLSSYLLAEPTDFEGEVNQQVYMVVVEYQGKKIRRQLDAHEKKANRVDVTFQKQQ